jgi:hypothetical protein
MSPDILKNHYYHEQVSGAKAIFGAVSLGKFFPDLGEISRKGRIVDSL